MLETLIFGITYSW